MPRPPVVLLGSGVECRQVLQVGGVGGGDVVLVTFLCSAVVDVAASSHFQPGERLPKLRYNRAYPQHRMHQGRGADLPSCTMGPYTSSLMSQAWVPAMAFASASSISSGDVARGIVGLLRTVACEG